MQTYRTGVLLIVSAGMIWSLLWLPPAVQEVSDLIAA